MKVQIEVEKSDLLMLYSLMEELNRFFHNEENYESVHEFADKNYKNISKSYYEVLWNWLPSDERERIENS